MPNPSALAQRIAEKLRKKGLLNGGIAKIHAWPIIDAELAEVRDSFESVLDSIGALTNPSELGGYAFSEEEIVKILAALASLKVAP